MFRWVQIWLDILLPAFDDQNTILRRDTAKARLKDLSDDGIQTDNAYHRLKADYQRLWDFNDLSEYRDQRVRLFQIVLGAFEPQTLESLTEALRIHGCEYDRELKTKQVQRLYCNFLYEDSSREIEHLERHSLEPGYETLRFVHDSARKFISYLDIGNVSASGEENEPPFSERSNHLAIAELYIDVVGLSTHPFWKATGLEPSNWSDINSDSPKADRLSKDLKRWSTRPASFHVYLARNGLRHCAVAAKKRSMFDETWSKVLERVVLDPISAFSFIILAARKFTSPYENKLPRTDFSTWCLLGEREGHVDLLYSHVLAFLGIIHEDDVSRLTHVTGNLCGTMEEESQRRLFEHAACVGGGFTCPLVRSRRRMEATALQLACQNGNRAAVEIIFQVSKCLSDDDTVAILFNETKRCHSPIHIAISNRYIQIVESLLRFEKRHSGMTGDGSCISKQWSLTHKIPAFHRAVYAFSENEISDLLSIARPEDINIRNPSGLTMLHQAARKGWLRLARELVEKYDADVEAKSSCGVTPSLVAFSFQKKLLLKYFKSRGANVEFNEEDSTEARVLINRWKTILRDTVFLLDKKD